MAAAAVGALTARLGADHCPGVLDLHEAADGPLARVRIPGGLLSPDTLAGLGELTNRCAAGTLDLTARGNVQLRGVHDPDALATGLGALGLLPSLAHDRARNFGVSPLTGLGVPRADAGRLDAIHVLRELDALVTADAALAELPGRFLMSVDDGSRSAPVADLALACMDNCWHLLLDGWDCGPAAPRDVVAAARMFLTERDGDATCWRVRELPGGAGRLARALGRPLGQPVPMQIDRLVPGPRLGGSVVVVAAWLQRLTRPQLAALVAATAPGELLRLAPAGRIVVPARDRDALRMLASTGLNVDASDIRGLITSCSGLSECNRATLDVRTIAASLSPARPTHLVACPRGCGRPEDAHLEIAT